ncbi:hypothetical protein AaE_010749, partial [Aphanomyces astaci]
MIPTIEDIAAALYRVEKGESVAAVARSSSIKRSTIHKYKTMKKATGSITIGKQGLKPLLPIHLEKDLVTWIAAMQRAGWRVERYEVVMKANKILNTTLAFLDRLDVIGAINRNVTRWSSTYSMLKRYVAIHTYIRLLGDRNILHLTPTDDQDDEIDALLLVLDELESVTLALQEVATSMLDVRNLFDECMLLHSSASKRLASNSAVVGHADFEVAITKILDQSVSSMSDGQVASVDRLKLHPKALDASQDKPLTLAQRA